MERYLPIYTDYYYAVLSDNNGHEPYALIERRSFNVSNGPTDTFTAVVSFPYLPDLLGMRTLLAGPGRLLPLQRELQRRPAEHVLGQRSGDARAGQRLEGDQPHRPCADLASTGWVRTGRGGFVAFWRFVSYHHG